MEKLSPKEHRQAMLMRRLALVHFIAIIGLCTCVLASPSSSMLMILLSLIVGVTSVLYFYVKTKEDK